ncbi:MAG: undecaprenyl-diphosphate phosphatase [Clostridia bacterium]|nr:undecaprenyl-diphosphate phosphatase [Clostridia bacterium]
MNIINAVVLGLIQGLAEFLPISSSGHLNLMQALPGVNVVNEEQQLLFNILLHVGTLLPLLVVFWKDWWRMLRHPIRNNTLLLLIIASLPALAAVLIPPVKAFLDKYQTGTTLLSVCFLFTGFLLLLTQWIAKRREHRQPKPHSTSPGLWNAIVMGCMQAVGILPGVSRSGSTIFGGVASGLNRETAAKFGFMMSAPAILAAFLKESYQAVSGSGGFTPFLAAIRAELIPIAVGVAVAAVSGYLAIRFMLKTIAKASLVWFALYVILLGIAVIVMQRLGILLA